MCDCTLCPARAVEQAIRESDLSLDIETGAGVVFISLIMTTLGLLLNACWRMLPWEGRRRAEWKTQRAEYLAAAKALGIKQPEAKQKRGGDKYPASASSADEGI